MMTTTTTNACAQSNQQMDNENDDHSDGMQSSQAGSEAPSDSKVKGTDENENGLLESSSTGSDSGAKSANSGGGYSADCSASDQASDQSSDCAASVQKQRSTMKLALNRVHLKYSSSSEMESSSPLGESSLEDEVTEPGNVSSISMAKARSNTAKRSLSSSLKASKNHEDTISASAAVAPGLTSSIKQNHRHPSLNQHRRRSRPRPRAHDDSPDDLNALLSDNSHKELANTPMFDGTQALPQWKGVRISHPMDPRIDISTVGLIQAPVLSVLGDTGSSPSYDLPSMETYMQLLSVSSWCFYLFALFEVNELYSFHNE
jgi:hypothetical protein